MSFFLLNHNNLVHLTPVISIFVSSDINNMGEQISNDPLHGKTLEVIVKFLVEYYGWEQLSTHINVRCFTNNPSIQSSLKFLRKTPWARKKVEDLYITVIRRG